jgi:hypothetical protein
MKIYQKNTKQEDMTQVKTKNKAHQELIKEIWDEADKSAMDILDEPIDLNLEDPFDNFFLPEKDEKTK